jgi:mannose-6-phosphate isomerase class I
MEISILRSRSRNKAKLLDGTKVAIVAVETMELENCILYSPMLAFRRSNQPLVPTHHEPTPPGQYDIYPGFAIGPGQIELGHEALAHRLAGQRQVTIDGQIGVLWDELCARLNAALAGLGKRAAWVDIEQALRPEADIDRLVAPYLGGDDPLFGTRFTGELIEFFDAAKLAALRPDPGADVNVVYGCGAALARWAGPVIYIDLPKNEVQYRSRAGSVRNLGASRPNDPKLMYKRFYFVDWVALGRHKAELMPRIEVVVDEQRPDLPALMDGAALRLALVEMGRSAFRARPWFEPGPWGGQWIKRHIPQLLRDAPNYAWSFELIAPENGLLLESDDRLLEVAFDTLMLQEHRAVLGESAKRFGYEFPIRFDFLDTFEGGNLSLQCHPRPDYIQRHFGEHFTQDETYYILDCQPGALVFLGFCDDVDPAAFRAALERSQREAVPVEVERFIHSEPAHPHDLFLIPSGTIHCSGANNLVLEISATPYIFTFKMYDWMRLDLDGRPRPLNVKRAFENLRFERQGDRVRAELIARPRVLSQGEGWRRVHLPTHAEHFYDVHRIEFTQGVEATTDGSCQVMNVVEGEAVLLETPNGRRQRFNYAETFVIPAGAEHYRLTNLGKPMAKVVVAFVKPGDAGLLQAPNE